MYRWILSLLALLGYTGMAAHAQQTPQNNQSKAIHSTTMDQVRIGFIESDGSTHP